MIETYRSCRVGYASLLEDTGEAEGSHLESGPAASVNSSPQIGDFFIRS